MSIRNLFNSKRFCLLMFCQLNIALAKLTLVYDRSTYQLTCLEENLNEAIEWDCPKGEKDRYSVEPSELKYVEENNEIFKTTSDPDDLYLPVEAFLNTDWEKSPNSVNNKFKIFTQSHSRPIRALFSFKHYNHPTFFHIQLRDKTILTIQISIRRETKNADLLLKPTGKWVFFHVIMDNEILEIIYNQESVFRKKDRFDGFVSFSTDHNRGIWKMTNLKGETFNHYGRHSKYPVSRCLKKNPIDGTCELEDYNKKILKYTGLLEIKAYHIACSNLVTKEDIVITQTNHGKYLNQCGDLFEEKLCTGYCIICCEGRCYYLGEPPLEAEKSSFGKFLLISILAIFIIKLLQSR